jgi:hypothetical protein
MRGFPKKIVEFAGKFCSFKRRRYLCTTKLTRWIHLRVRIRASHARHRGSNPLSTTKRSVSGRFFLCAAPRWGGVIRRNSARFQPPGFFACRVFSVSLGSRMACASRFRVFPTVACPQLPGFFACRVFSVSLGSRMACASRWRVFPTSRGRHVPDVFKCSGRPKKDGRCGIEVKGYLIGWWVYFSDLLLNLSN